MINWTLYKYEMRKSLKLLIILAAIITMYVTIIIGLYDPAAMAQLNALLETFKKMMPELVSAVGIKDTPTSLIGFMISYLYGFLLILLPILFSIIKANGLIAKYVDNNSIVGLVASPIKRGTIAFTQLMVLIGGIVILISYTTALQALLCFNQINIWDLIKLNSGLLSLQLFVGSLCFLSSCFFSDSKQSLGFGMGIVLTMFLLQMIANAGKDVFKYFTFFTLFDPYGLVANQGSAFIGSLILLVLAGGLMWCSIVIFSKKDLHI